MVRNATNRDFPALRLVRKNLTDEAIADRLTQQSQGYTEFLVVEEQGQIGSFILLKWRGKPTHPEHPDMVDLYTKESERGKGFASQLILECERLAKKKGFHKIGMSVNPNRNTAAKKLYERLGYYHDGGLTYLDGVYDGVEDWCIDLQKDLE